MKYLEELSSGDCFNYNHKLYLLTCDFKNNGSRLCVSLIDGLPSWMSGNTMVEITQLYTLDENNNITPVKADYHAPTNKN